MKKEAQNYLFICMGFGVIILIIIFHFFDAINSLLYKYNRLIRNVNDTFNSTIKEETFLFFGNGMNDINLLIDLILLIIVLIVMLMVFFKIYWSIQDNRLTEQNI